MTEKNTPRVGFGNPPRRTRFKPGVSGNPAGRPKKLATLQSEVLAELGDVSTYEDGEIEISNARKIARALVQAAVGGNMRATVALLTFTAKQHGDADIVDGPTSGDAAILEDFLARELRRRAQESGAKSDPMANLGKEEAGS
jgi:hypothetical protein